MPAKYRIGEQPWVPGSASGKLYRIGVGEIGARTQRCKDASCGYRRRHHVRAGHRQGRLSKLYVREARSGPGSRETS